MTLRQPTFSPSLCWLLLLGGRCFMRQLGEATDSHSVYLIVYATEIMVAQKAQCLLTLLIKLVLCQRLVGCDFVLNNHPAGGAVLFSFYAKCWKVKRGRCNQTRLIISQAGRRIGVQCFDHVRSPLIPLCFSLRARCMFPKTGCQI